jgi:hypothetical protein
MTHRGQVRNGQIVLEQGASLRDGTVVVVTAMEEASGRQERDAAATLQHVGLSRPESELLQRISDGLPPGVWARYHELIGKRDDGTLAPAEHRELIDLSDRIEQANASRLALAAELARLRGVPLVSLLRDLGIPGGARA